MDPASALVVMDHFVTPERAYYADPEEYGLLPLRPAARKGLLRRNAVAGGKAEAENPQRPRKNQRERDKNELRKNAAGCRGGLLSEFAGAGGRRTDADGNF